MGVPIEVITELLDDALGVAGALGDGGEAADGKALEDGSGGGLGGYKTTPVDSTDVASVAYDGDTRVLTVNFNSGRTYTYDDVTPADAAAIRYGDPGRTLWHTIIPKYGKGSG